MHKEKKPSDEYKRHLREADHRMQQAVQTMQLLRRCQKVCADTSNFEVPIDWVQVETWFETVKANLGEAYYNYENMRRRDETVATDTDGESVGV